MLKEMRQLNMLTVRDVEVKAKSLGMEPTTGRSGLLDSGASHAYRLGTPEELQAADKVRVQLATGEHVTLAQNRAGTLLATKSTDQDLASPIVPLGSLVQDLNCKLTWSRKRGLEIMHPIHGVIKPRVVGQCPLVGEAQALQLIKELEDKRVEDLQRANMVMQRTLWAWDRETRWSRCLETFLLDGRRTSQLQAMEAEGSPYKSLSTTLKGALADDVMLNNSAGWAYLKALPISRRRRKQLMTTSWMVNLFSGPSDGTVEFKVLEDGAVLVEMDIVRSKAFDLRKPAGAYRALLWAAATGRIKGMMASPPTRSELDEELIAKTMWCSMVAKASRSLYGDPPPFVMMEGYKMLNYVKNAMGWEKPTGLQRAWEAYCEVMNLEDCWNLCGDQYGVQREHREGDHLGGQVDQGVQDGTYQFD